MYFFSLPADILLVPFPGLLAGLEREPAEAGDFIRKRSGHLELLSEFIPGLRPALLFQDIAAEERLGIDAELHSILFAGLFQFREIVR